MCENVFLRLLFVRFQGCIEDGLEAGGSCGCGRTVWDMGEVATEEESRMIYLQVRVGTSTALTIEPHNKDRRPPMFMSDRRADKRANGLPRFPIARLVGLASPVSNPLTL